jgi:lactate permease
MGYYVLAAGPLGMALITGGLNVWYGIWLAVVLGMLALMHFTRARGAR